jgi:hypothetical protein
MTLTVFCCYCCWLFLHWKNPVVPLAWSALDVGLYCCFIISIDPSLFESEIEALPAHVEAD